MTDESANPGGSAADAASAPGLPAAVQRATFAAELDRLRRVRGEAHTREGDAIAAARRRLPMVEVDATTPLTGPHGTVTLLDAFQGRRQLIAYYFMWWACSSRRRAVRRLHLGHRPGGRAVLPAFPRHHLRGLLPGPLRRERPLPRLHGLGHAVVLRPGLPRRAPGPAGQARLFHLVATCATATGSSKPTGRNAAAQRRWTTATRSWT